MNGDQYNRQYTVKELSGLAGVTVRTLHLYDKIGLLKPSVRTEKRYRLYGEEELFRLQQILFYRELDLPLKEITNILDDPDFDLIKALESQKISLKSKKKRISEMLGTIEKTILNLKGKIRMTHDELYAGLPKGKAERWQKFAQEKWPDQVTHSQKMLLTMSKEKFEQLHDSFKANLEALADLRRQPPENPKVQNEIAKHYGYIQQFWGKRKNIRDAFKGLGQLYVDEPLYAIVAGKPDKNFALFLRDAMIYYVDKNL